MRQSRSAGSEDRLPTRRTLADEKDEVGARGGAVEWSGCGCAVGPILSPYSI